MKYMLHHTMIVILSYYLYKAPPVKERLWSIRLIHSIKRDTPKKTVEEGEERGDWGGF